MMHPMIRRLAGATALALLCLAPLPLDARPATTASPHGADAAACDDAFAWRSCGGNPWAGWRGKKKGADKGKKNGADQGLKVGHTGVLPATAAQVHDYMVSNGENRASSNPTTVPVVDDDLKFAINPTLDQIKARGAHRVTLGAGVVVAVIDGGFNLDHPAIAGRLTGTGYDAIDQDFDAHDTGNGIDDDYDGVVDGAAGHGTFVAGQVLEVAPEALILPIRARDDEGWGTNKQLEDALMQAWLMGADVINVSGQSTIGRSRQITYLVEYFHRIGIVVVNSAGNKGADWISEIGDEGTALVVGSVDGWDRLTPWSNRPAEAGRHFVVAPGVDLYGPLGTDGSDDNWGWWSGTSFSTALVSGGAALLKSAYPWLGSADVIDLLRFATDPAYDEDGLALPYGRLNLAKAVTR